MFLFDFPSINEHEIEIGQTNAEIAIFFFQNNRISDCEIYACQKRTRQLAETEKASNEK